jgi:hypothetical protein
MMGVHGCMRGFFFISEFDIGWMKCRVNFLKKIKAGNHNFKTSIAWLGGESF